MESFNVSARLNFGLAIDKLPGVCGGIGFSGHAQIGGGVKKHTHVEKLFCDVGSAERMIKDADGARGKRRQFVAEQTVHRRHGHANFTFRRDERRVDDDGFTMWCDLPLEKHVKQHMVGLWFDCRRIKESEMFLRRQFLVTLGVVFISGESVRVCPPV